MPSSLRPPPRRESSRQPSLGAPGLLTTPRRPARYQATRRYVISRLLAWTLAIRRSQWPGRRFRSGKRGGRRRRRSGRLPTGPADRAAAAPIEPVRGATRSDVGGVRLEIGRAGAARVKRVVYPPGFRWSVDMKPEVGTDLCMHGHVGFLASAIRIEYPDGCALELVAPQVVAIEPGHDGAVIGDAPAVLIELDFEKATVERLGLPAAHRHA